MESEHDVSNRMVPRAFGDLRGWIVALEQEGELHTIDAEIDWDCELGTIARRAFGNGDGPALRFTNITGYGPDDAARPRGVADYSDVGADRRGRGFCGGRCCAGLGCRRH